ncbi:MAG: SDR family NAD(P)-dependent oxidoreductase, partial [Kiritimatiellae bacterium]|nr:SDR family NAD(P)-dependent oxidoreductase [Kiritimatiellia bacterium]
MKNRVSSIALALCDSAAMAAAYAAAFMLRFDFREPMWGWGAVWVSFATVWFVQTLSLAAFGCTKRRGIRPLDLPRFAAAFTVSCTILLALRALLPDVGWLFIRPPYTISFLNTFFAAAFVGATRYLAAAYNTARQQTEALLHREESIADTEDVVRLLAGKCVMVTGAGGSIGSEIVRQCALCGAGEVLMVERSEHALYEIDRRMRALNTNARCVPVLADVNDTARMRDILARHKPQTILHAAAYKHVPMVEMHPLEGLRNNTLATRLLGEVAVEAGVERFVMISTDKAVNPVSAM